MTIGVSTRNNALAVSRRNNRKSSLVLAVNRRKKNPVSVVSRSNNVLAVSKKKSALVVSGRNNARMVSGRINSPSSQWEKQ